MASHTLAKGLEILLMLGREGSPVSVKEMAERLSIPQSSLYRILATLKEYGLVVPADSSGHMGLGFRVLALARSVENKNLLLKYSLQVMRKLCEASGETIFLSGLHGNRSIVLERVDSPNHIRFVSEVGAIKPLYAGASGKIMLAFLPKSKQKKIIEKAESVSLANGKQLEQKEIIEELDIAKKNGYSVSDSEVYKGVKSIAAPIFLGEKQVFASIAILGPEIRITSEKVKEFSAIVKEGAKKVTKIIGKELSLNNKLTHGID